MASLAGVVLPHEIWIKIFKHLTTSDILNLCNVSEDHKYLLREKDVVKYFDIGCNPSFYNIDLAKFITQNVEYRYIKTLNINQFYWLPLKEIRYIVTNLHNLQELFALDTRLGLRPKDVKLYGKLQTLAITICSRECNSDPSLYKNNMYMLKKFCVNIGVKQEHFSSLYKLFSELTGLEELWINDTDGSIIQPIKYDYIVFKLKFLKKLVIKSEVNIPFLDYKPFGLAKFFETRRFKSIVMCYERYPAHAIVPYKHISLFEPLESEIEKAWDVIRKFQCEMPYGIKSAKEVYKTKQIKDVEFDELNFFHTRCFCNPSFIKATLDFLRSKNSKNLQKLSVKSCILQRNPTSKEHSVANLQERKYPVIDVIENCKNLKTLELMSCANCNVSILDAYPFISNWVELEKLTIEVPSHSDGKFLKEVLMLCTKLKSLRVISNHINTRLNVNVCQALPYGSALEDFSFDNKQFNLGQIFLSLNTMVDCKLRRICLSADTSQAPPLRIVKEFLEKNDQLVFFYIALTDYQKQPLHLMQELFDIYKKKNPAKLFYAKRSIDQYIGPLCIPLVYKEFMGCDTDVSTVDFFSFR